MSAKINYKLVSELFNQITQIPGGNKYETGLGYSISLRNSLNEALIMSNCNFSLSDFKDMEIALKIGLEALKMDEDDIMRLVEILEDISRACFVFKEHANALYKIRDANVLFIDKMIGE